MAIDFSCDPRELLMRLVEIPSVTHDEDRACDYLTQVLGSFGWKDAHRDEVGNVVATRGFLSATAAEREIVLMGHIDTVPGGPIFRVEAENILWGRGSVDAKGPLCALIVGGGMATIPEGWRLTLIAAVGEEGDSRGARHGIPLHRPAACVIGEPSGTTGITIGYRGALRLQVYAHDSGAHRSGDPGPLTASLMTASDILREVERRDDGSKPVIERPSGAVVAMWGKEAGERSGLVDLDIRLPIGAAPEEWARDFIELEKRHNTEIKLLSSMPAHLVRKNDPLVRALRVAVRTTNFATMNNLGEQTPRLLAKGGTADFNLAAAWNCPMVAYGPGDSKLDHTAEEHIDLNEYLWSASILKNALEEFTKQSEQGRRGGSSV